MLLTVCQGKVHGMENVKDIDDLYSGYNDDNPALMDAVRFPAPFSRHDLLNK